MEYYQKRRSVALAKYAALDSVTKAKFEKDNPRKEVTQKEDISYVSTFTKIHKQAQEFANKWNKNIKDVSLEHSYTENYGSYSSEVRLEVKGLEIDEQYHLRLAEHYEALTGREELERKEFERLKAKFSE